MNKIEAWNFSSATQRKQPCISEKRKLLQLQKNTCYYCGSTFGEYIQDHKGRLLCLQPVYDHLLPYSYSFNNSFSNFVAACRICNGFKSNKIFDTIEEAVHYVRNKRKEKGLPLFELRTGIQTKEEMAEVLFWEMSNRVLLETPSSGTNLIIDDLEQRKQDVKFMREWLKEQQKSKS